MKTNMSLFWSASLFLLMLSAHAGAPGLVDTLRGAEQNGSLGDFFGDHVAASGQWLIVGAPREDVDLDADGFFDPQAGEVDTGAVYIYRRSPSGFELHQKLVGEGNNRSTLGDRFGAGVALQGGWLFAGAANDNDFPGLIDPNPDPDFGPFTFAGKVYVFRFDPVADLWVGPSQRLISDVPQSGMSFGGRTDSAHVAPFAFDPDIRDPAIVLIGEPSSDNPTPAKLHVFRRNADRWERIDIATSPSGATDSSFADKVVRARSFALVTETGLGAPLDTPKVHVYRVDADGLAKAGGTALPLQSLDAPGGPSDVGVCAGRFFGAGMSAARGIAVIADPCDSTIETASGAVHLYRVHSDGGPPLTLQQTLPNPDPAALAFYGANFASGRQSIATNGAALLVGTADLFVPDRPVDVYRRTGTGYALLGGLPSPEPGDPFSGTLYGQSVSFLGLGEVAVGQMGSLSQGGGRVFVFGTP